MHRSTVRRHLWLRTSMALYGAAVFGLAVAALSGPNPYGRKAVVAELPPITLTPPSSGDAAHAYVIREAFRRGETLPAFLERIGAEDEALLDYTSLDEQVRAIQRQLRAHSTATVRLRADGQVDALVLPLVSGERVTIRRSDEGFRLESPAPETAGSTHPFLELRQGVITHSLFATAAEIGMPDAIATKLAEIFGTEIDFSRDLREGGLEATLFEARPQAGGMAAMTIPGYRLQPAVVARDVKRLEAAGVKFEFGKVAGRDFTFESLKQAGYDYIVVAAGAQRGSALGIEGEQAEGVLDGISWLRDVWDGVNGARAKSARATA